MKPKTTKLRFRINGVRRQLRVSGSEFVVRQIQVGIQSVIDRRSARMVLTDTEQVFVDTLPHSVRHKLVEWGLVKEVIVTEKPLTEYLEQLSANMIKKGRGLRHRKEIIGTLKRIFEECEFVTWGDISQQKLIAYLDDLRDGGKGIGKRRYNGLLGMVKFFCGRMVYFGNAKFSPVEYTEGLENPQTDKRHSRRILEDDDLQRFLFAAAEGLDYKGFTGMHRNFIYRFALETALRSVDFDRLRVKDCDFKNHKVMIRAGRIKNKKDTKVYLKPETSIELAQYCMNKLPDAAVFHLPDKLAALVRFDLAAAGIPYEVNGEFFDFHALKHQSASIYAANPETPEAVRQSLTHHTTPEMARKYSHATETAQRKAVNAAPDLRRSSESQQATGTDSKTLPKRCTQDTQSGTPADTGGQKNGDTKPKPPFQANNKGGGRIPKPKVAGSNPAGRIFFLSMPVDDIPPLLSPNFPRNPIAGGVGTKYRLV